MAYSIEGLKVVQSGNKPDGQKFYRTRVEAINVRLYDLWLKGRCKDAYLLCLESQQV